MQANVNGDREIERRQYCYNFHEMQCMKFLRSNLQNPSQKFHKNLFDFEQSQVFKKNAKT